MLTYKHVLVAVDLSSISDQVLQRARQIATESQAKLSLVHIMEHSPLAYGGEFSIPIDINVEQTLERQGLDALTDLGNLYQVAPADQYFKQGSVKHVVNDLATALSVDLIVVGTHGHHGMDILLGSHANAILHKAKCDVLVVRVRESAKS